MQFEASESDEHESAEGIFEDEVSAESEESDSEDDRPLANFRKKMLYGKKGYKWYSDPFSKKKSCTSKKNV